MREPSAASLAGLAALTQGEVPLLPGSPSALDDAARVLVGRAGALESAADRVAHVRGALAGTLTTAATAAAERLGEASDGARGLARLLRAAAEVIAGFAARKRSRSAWTGWGIDPRPGESGTSGRVPGRPATSALSAAEAGVISPENSVRAERSPAVPRWKWYAEATFASAAGESTLFPWSSPPGSTVVARETSCAPRACSAREAERAPVSAAVAKAAVAPSPPSGHTTGEPSQRSTRPSSTVGDSATR